MVNIDKIANWLRKTEGRDKACKILQYLCRFMAAHYRIRNEDYFHLLFNSLFQSIRQARKLFRLFKSIDQYQSIIHMIFYGEQQLLTVLHILTKSLYFLYWIFDNISVVGRVKLFNINHQMIHKMGVKIRFMALFFSVAVYFYQVKFKEMDQKQRLSVDLKAAKNLFDLLPAGKDSGFISASIGERVVSVGGFISALISTYQIYVQP